MISYFNNNFELESIYDIDKKERKIKTNERVIIDLSGNFFIRN